MRIMLLVVALLLAGCSESSSNGTPDGTPISGGDAGEGVPQAKPDPVEIDESGSLLEGFHGDWEFDLNSTVQNLAVTVGLRDPVGTTAMVYHQVSVTLMHNNTVVLSVVSPTSTNYGSATSTLLSYTVEVSEETDLADHAGAWEVKLDSGNNPVDYFVSIDADY